MHINARSLSTNIDSIITELSLLVDKPTIIAITETRLSKSDSDSLPIPGYISILTARTYKTGGGVGLQLKRKTGLNYKLRMDLRVDNKSDSMFIQIINTKSRNIITGVIYKPPDMDVIKV